MTKKAIIIPCSGIGKPYGTIARDATFKVCEELLKDNAETDCLGALVIKDEETVKNVLENTAYAVDGCFNECARKSIERVGGEVKEAFHVWKFHQENKDLKPKTVTFLDEDGQEFADRLAEVIAKKVKEDMGGEQ